MSIATELQRIIDAKADIVRALGKRGIQIPSGSTLDEFAEIIDPYTSGKTIDWADNPDNYLSFKFVTDGSVRWQDMKGDIQYSKDEGTTWTYFNGATVFCDAGDEVWFKGTLTGGCGTYNDTGSSKFYTAGKFYAAGNVQSISNFNNTLTAYHFSFLFQNCNGLNISIEKQLLLPATTLADYCYQNMFSGCKSLTSVPELPATSLATRCYDSMFAGCTSLTTPPSSIGTSATTMGASACTSMFESCTSLTTAPALPAVTLASFCYSSMFNGCTSLTTAPALPATTLAYSCYQYMFNGCTSLMVAPELPATALANYCYQYMFSGCTNITTGPSVLPATILAQGCYRYMFSKCDSLTTAPVLPATTLTQDCYHDMFYMCNNLTTAPMLPATTLASSCYTSMFQGCASLTTAPELPATTLANYCYTSMFNGCSSLITAPELPATTLTNYCYYGMFSGCKNLNYIKCLATNMTAASCTYSWVRDVASSGTFIKDASASSWETGNNGIPNNWTVQKIGFGVSKNMIALWESGGTEQITIISTNNPWTATTEDNWFSLSQISGTTGETPITVTASLTSTPRTGNITFTDGDKSITLLVVQNDNLSAPLTFEIISGGTVYWKKYGYGTDAPIKYKKNNDALRTLQPNNSISVTAGDVVEFYGNYINSASYQYHTFSGSTAIFNVKGNIMSLVNSEEYVTSNLSTDYAVAHLFAYARVINANKLTLPKAGLTEGCYEYMFQACTGLTGAPELQATTLAMGCYGNMFYGCTNLTTAPELPATTMTGSCYHSMFGGCTRLNYIKCLATNPNSSYMSGWVQGVAASGNFVKAAGVTWPTAGTSSIPSGWTVQDAS